MKIKSLLFIPFILLLTPAVYAGQNVSISEFVNSIRGSFNMVIAKENVVSARRLKKTKRMIHKGYLSEIRNMEILLEQTGADATLRAFSPKRYPGFAVQEENAIEILDNMVKTLTTNTKSSIENSRKTFESNSDLQIDTDSSGDGSDDIALSDDVESADDIGTDLDFDGNLFDTTDDTAEVGEQKLSHGAIAQAAFLDIAEEYVLRSKLKGLEVTWFAGNVEEKVKLGQRPITLKQMFVPIEKDNMLRPQPVHAVFASTFLPNRNGVLHVMEMYIILIINEPGSTNPQVSVTPVNKFRWDRNPYYISAATGTVMKKIFSTMTGKKLGSY